MSLFQDLKPTFTPDSVASKLTYFQEQIHLLHWNTSSYAEHQALGGLYEYIQDFKDDVMEKLMGYMNTKVKPYKIEALTIADPIVIVDMLDKWAYELYLWAETQHYCDVENMAQELSGKAAKTKYLLTLS